MHHYSQTLDSQDPNNLPQNPNVCLSPRPPGQAFKYVSFPFRSRSPIRTRCLCLWAQPPTPTTSLAFGAEDTLCLEPASLFLEISLYALYIAASPEGCFFISTVFITLYHLTVPTRSLKQNQKRVTLKVPHLIKYFFHHRDIC